MEKVIIACAVIFHVVLFVHAQDGFLNDPCRVVQECGDVGFFCARNRTCQCFQGYTPDKQYKKCLGGVEQRCLYDEHCVEGAYCQNQKKCQCKVNLVPTYDGLACTKWVPLTGSAQFQRGLNTILLIAISLFNFIKVV